MSNRFSPGRRFAGLRGLFVNKVKIFGLENLPEGDFSFCPKISRPRRGSSPERLPPTDRFIVNESIYRIEWLPFPLDRCDPDAKRVGGSSCAGGCRPHLPRRDRLHLFGSRTRSIETLNPALPWVRTSRKSIRETGCSGLVRPALEVSFPSEGEKRFFKRPKWFLGAGHYRRLWEADSQRGN